MFVMRLLAVCIVHLIQETVGMEQLILFSYGYGAFAASLLVNYSIQGKNISVKVATVGRRRMWNFGVASNQSNRLLS